MKPNRFWQCECCTMLIVTMPQDSAEDYQCPQCARAGCEHGGMFKEIDRATFVREALGNETH